MKEIKNKKIFIVVVLVMVLGAIGVTYAISSTTDILDNLLNTKGYDVSVLETFESPDNWVPGTTVEKIVKAKSDSDTYTMIRMSYTEEWKDKDGNVLPLVDSNNERATIINFDPELDTKWIKSTENGTDYYYYYRALGKNRETSAFITSVTFNPNIDGASTVNCVDNSSTNTKTCTMAAGAYAGGTYKLTVRIESAEADHYKEIWSTSEDLITDGRDVLSEYVSSLVGNSYIDNTDPDSNVRYIGVDPPNYVSFSNEEWRIIGVFDGRVKLYRKDSIGQYSWDYSSSSINSGYGVNEWSQSDLMAELNGDYLNVSLTTNPYWKYSYSGTREFDRAKVLTYRAQKLIDDALWYLGSPSNNNGTYDSNFNYVVTPIIAYNRERSEYLGKTCSSGSSCNDYVTRQPTWTGKVGLPYASDFALATDGGSPSGRATCMNTGLYRFNDYNCGSNSWMIDNNGQLLIDPMAASSSAYNIYYQSNGGYLYYNSASSGGGVHPTVYLKATIHIDGGTGTQSDPYIISE